MKNKTILERNVLEQITRVSAHDLIQFGGSRGWKFRILGSAPVPTIVIGRGKWIIVPEHMDDSPLPVSAIQKQQAIHHAGFKPKAYVLVHEVPQKPPTDQRQKTKLPTHKPSDDRSTNFNIDIGEIVKKVLSTFGLILAAAVLIDPILVAITEDDVWVEIERWWVKEE